MTPTWRRLDPLEIDHEALWLLVGAASLCLLGAPGSRRASSCPAVRSRRSRACPARPAASPRTIIAISRGDLDRALFLNPLATVACLGGAGVPGPTPPPSWRCGCRGCGRRCRRPPPGVDASDHGAVAVVAVNGICSSRLDGEPAASAAGYDRSMSTARPPGAPSAVPARRRDIGAIGAELRPLGQLAWPVVLAEIGWMAMGIVDTLMVGPAGPPRSAAAGSAAAFLRGRCLQPGTPARARHRGSQAYGAGEPDACRRWLFHGLGLGLSPSLTFVGCCASSARYAVRGCIPTCARRARNLDDTVSALLPLFFTWRRAAICRRSAWFCRSCSR